MEKTALIYAIVCSFSIVCVSLTGSFLLSFSDRILKKILMLLLCFACGAFIANLCFHLLPEIFHWHIFGNSHSHLHSCETLSTLCTIVLFALGFAIFWLINSYLKHQHKKHCQHSENCQNHKTSLGLMNLYSDSLHNFADGLMIAAAFSVSKEAGLASTLAIILHEIPQEISDFAILLHSGYSKGKAVVYNLLAALPVMLAVLLFAVFGEHFADLNLYLTPVITGTFLYYITFSLFPEIFKNTTKKNISFHITAVITGILLIVVVI
ncbi:MAG: ZIP family metal transporter [Bacteroidales bacterium]|jgi:zinc and cadmium transporter|nr:ZIP family metal transporter [Bacteroidales bacterium]